MVENQTFITEEGLTKLKEELEHLKTSKRQGVAKRIQEAKELGDLSENAEYADAKEEQAFTEGRILELEETIRNAKIIQNDKKSSTVQVGSKIFVKNQDEEKEFRIVGSNEADPSKGLISNNSPMGKAFIGKKAGDAVEFSAPKGKVVYEILEIE